MWNLEKLNSLRAGGWLPGAGEEAVKVCRPPGRRGVIVWGAHVLRGAQRSHGWKEGSVLSIGWFSLSCPAVQALHTQNSSRNQQAHCKIHVDVESRSVVLTIWKIRSKVGGLALPDFKPCWKVTVIRTTDHGCGCEWVTVAVGGCRHR